MQSAADARSAVLELVPSDEERMMRDTVARDLLGLRPDLLAPQALERASRPPSSGTRSRRRATSA